MRSCSRRAAGTCRSDHRASAGEAGQEIVQLRAGKGQHVGILEHAIGHLGIGKGHDDLAIRMGQGQHAVEDILEVPLRADAAHRPVFGFRGASGIDGTLSMAAGLALSHGRATLLCGDLALLHDANGWLWREQLAAGAARLTVVLVDNAGGGIFEQLPIRTGPQLDFERLFAMPQRLDHSALAAGYGVAARSIEALDQLPEALSWAALQPMALLHVRTDRRVDAALRRHCRRTMASIHQGLDGGNTLS